MSENYLEVLDHLIHVVLLLDFIVLINRYLDSMQLQEASKEGTKGQGVHKKRVLEASDGLLAPLWQLTNGASTSITTM